MDPKTFAFILHSGSVEELKKSYPLFRMVPDFILKRSFRGIAPFKVSQLKDIRSLKGKDISGFFIDCPILIEEGQQPEERLVFGKILSAASLARKMGAEIIGTGGCASLFKDGGEAVAKHLNMPFTNGNALTAWSVFEASGLSCAINRLKNRPGSQSVTVSKRHVQVLGNGFSAVFK
jgi:predicted amino acid dehydrogenase